MGLGVSMEPVRASVILLTYNQEAYVEEALQSLLEQDYENLEIVVSDDCSQDNTWAIVCKQVADYKGTKSILLNRNLQNIGLVANYTKAFHLTSGDLVFTAAGDDISLPSRCSECINYWKKLNPSPDLLAADGYDMALDGTILGVKNTDNLDAWDLTAWAKKRPFIFGASHMMTRRLIASNNLNPSLMYEDQCLFFRSLLMNGAVRLNQPLVKHRRGGVSQAKKNYVYEIKRKRMLASSVDGNLECNQMLADASLNGLHDHEVLSVIKKQIQLNEFICEIFAQNTFWRKCVLMCKKNELPVAKRFRYFHFSAFPSLHYLAMKVKFFFRMSKQ